MLAVDEERQVKLERGTVVRVGDWTIRAFPRRGECTSGDEEILLVREFAEPERPPAGIVLAGRCLPVARVCVQVECPAVRYARAGIFPLRGAVEGFRGGAKIKTGYLRRSEVFLYTFG